MKNITYSIIEQNRFNLKGGLEHINFQIRYRKSFYGLFTYWKYITHQDCGWGDCYDSITNFGTKKEATIFIKEILCPGKTYDGWETNTVDEITCSDN